MSALSAFFCGPAKTKVLTLGERGGEISVLVCALTKKPDQTVDMPREWKSLKAHTPYIKVRKRRGSDSAECLFFDEAIGSKLQL